MISLAGRDILHAWGKYIFTGIGLGLLIGATLSMAGIYRGMVVGIAPGGPGEPGWPGYLVGVRHITRGHYEAVADVKAGLVIGERIKIRLSLIHI